MRLTLSFTVLVLVVLVVLAFILGEVIERVYVDRLGDELVDQAQVTAYAISLTEPERSSPGEVSDLIEELGARGDTRLTLIDADGRVIADTMADPSMMENHSDRAEIAEARTAGVGQSTHASPTDNKPYLYIAVQVPGGDGQILRAAVPLEDVEDAVRSMQRAILLAVGVSGGVSAIASWWLAGRIVRPLASLREQANRVGAGDVSARVPHIDLWEIDEVGQAFNVMTPALAQSLDSQERVTLRLEAVMNGLVDGVVLTDDEGRLLRLNRAAAALFNVDEPSVLSLPFVQAIRDHEVAQVLQQALSENRNVQADVTFGIEQLTLQVSARTVTGANERLGLVVLRDVSELHRLENVRREFVANVSHELRTPLTSIRALVETLEIGAIDDRDMAADFLGRIVGEVERLNALVEDLLDFARMEAGRAPLQIAKENIGQILHRGADRLKPQIEHAGLTLAFDIPDDLPEIAIDSYRIEQVLLNLIHNAIKFTPSDGKITISAVHQRPDIVITVADTGAGIEPVEQSRLFERFYKSDKARHSDGTGLGLAIAKHIVQLHGGSLWVESVPGEGAAFMFALPVRGKKARRRARRRVAGLM